MLHSQVWCGRPYQGVSSCRRTIAVLRGDVLVCFSLCTPACLQLSCVCFHGGAILACLDCLGQAASNQALLSSREVLFTHALVVRTRLPPDML